MSISLSRYVSITSGVGAGTTVGTRNLGALIITNNALCPTGTVLQFTSAANVLSYFGSASEEYARSLFYFGFISKNIQAPQQISFYFWNNNVATGSLIYGAAGTYSVSTFTAISAGALNLTLGGFNTTLTGINLSAAGALSTVASTIQTAVRAYTAGGIAWTGATIAYNATVGQFTLTSGATGVDVVAIAAAGSGTDLAAPLGWLSPLAVLSNGTAAQTVPTNLTNLLTITNNFGSFAYTTALAMTLANVTAAANWNAGLSPNLQFIYSVPITSTNAVAWAAALGGIQGTTGTLVSPLAGAYAEMEPMMILAATNYSQRNGVQNYMFQQFNDTPSVTTDAQANIYDPLSINYYGQTQTAGQNFAFYQRGVMFGTSLYPQDQNTYANEMWLKDAIGAQVMTLLLSLSQIPANNQGQAILMGAIQSVIGQALFNGTIQTGRTLTTAQQLYITQATGSSTAWQQVANAGYWLGVTISPYTASNGQTQYKAVYTLIYAKDNVVRLVQGSDILI